LRENTAVQTEPGCRRRWIYRGE